MNAVQYIRDVLQIYAVVSFVNKLMQVRRIKFAFNLKWEKIKNAMLSNYIWKLG